MQKRKPGQPHKGWKAAARKRHEERSADTGPRFDVRWGEHGPSLDYHFCRGWDIDATGEQRGCYGTNPDHGYTWSEARKEMADYHVAQAARWRKMTLKEWGHEDAPAEPQER